MKVSHKNIETAQAETNPRRRIPAVDEMLNRPAMRALEGRCGRRLVLEATRQVLEGLRARLAAGSAGKISMEELEKEIAAASEAQAAPSLVRVVNATGVILHTNLGRAPLAAAALEHLREVAASYSNLEFDLERGERGKRDAHTNRLLAQLLGAETTLVVNNNAAAVFLALNALAEDGEVIVSRGELIEIGDSFRIPEICAKSGAVLREVGTTNRTRLGDYAAALNERTRSLLRVHPSNFRIQGFTERPRLEELADLAHKHNLPLIEDLGSGCLVDLEEVGLRGEPPVAPSLRAGADVVTFSGDKLLGGPQAGILTGRREPLAKIRRNPLYRALRVDKLTIAALESTVALYLRGDLEAIPALRMMRMPLEEIAARAEKLAARLGALRGITARVEAGESVLGGGSTPGQALPTRVVAVRRSGSSAQDLEARLRAHTPPIIARLEHDQVLLDPRTLLEGQEDEIVRAFESLV